MPSSSVIFLRSIYGLTALTVALAGCSSFGGAPTTGAQIAPNGVQAARLGGSIGSRPASGSQDLYIGNILGGVPLYSTGKNPQKVGDITNQLPRVTDVWVDKIGVLYVFTDNRQNPYETIEEFQPGAASPFFSLVLKRYGSIVAADSAQNVYAQGTNGEGKSVVDVYPPGSQIVAHEYVVPTIGQASGIEGIAFDLTGALLVGVASLANNRQGQVGAVFRLIPNSTTFINLNLQDAYGGLIATDGAGNLYVGGGRLISVYAPGATSPSRIVHSKQPVVSLTAASDGTLYVSTYGDVITVYKPGRKTSQNSFVPQAQVSGLALGPG